MELLQLEQGTQEWKDARNERFTATGAVAVMGASKYQTRKQLLDEKSGVAPEIITTSKQILFNKGHKAEDDARNVLAVEEMDDYLPCVGVCLYHPSEDQSFKPLPLMASFDGRSDNEDHLFEHKLWNETLAENVRNNVLEPSHYWQLEHQLLVDERAEYVLFVVSDGTAEKREMMKYYPVEGRAEELIAAWALFQSDLESHQVEAKQEVVVADKQLLPMISCSVTGSQITTNLSSCLDTVKALALSEMSRSFETDQDFANKDQLNKDVKKARAELKERVASVKSEFVSYSEFETVALEMDSVLQKMQSAGEKQVKQAKEAKKDALKNNAMLSLSNHVTECNALTGAPFSIEQVIQLTPDWLGAMKNKRTIKSIEDALDTELNNWKVQLTTATEVIAPNFKFLEINANDYKFLFQDVFTLINQPEESFQATVTTRINDHKKIEAEKLAKETAEAEAAKKIADAEALIRKQEREKVEAEQKATAEHVEAISINADFDEYKEQQKVLENAPKPKVEAKVIERQAIDVEPVIAKIATQPVIQQPNVTQQQCNLHHDLIEWCNFNAVSGSSMIELESLINKHYSK